MPNLASSLSTSQDYIPAVNSTQVGKFAGLHMHFPTLAALNAAVTIERANVAAVSPMWADNQVMSAGDEPAFVRRVWGVAGGHSRRVMVRPGLEVVLAADSNTVLAAAGIPAAGTGANGDLSVDWAGNVLYAKAAGAWAVSVAAIYAAGVSGTRTYRGTVASQAAMLALPTVNVGDWVIRSDLSQTFELTTAGPSTLANWTALPAGGQFSGGTLTSALNHAPQITLASAATVAIGAAASNTINITGVAPITAFDSIAAGAVRTIIFGGSLTLTHNAVSLILLGGANIVTVAGDAASVLSLGSGNWRMIDYIRTSGSALVSGNGVVSTAALIPSLGYQGNGVTVIDELQRLYVWNGVSAYKQTGDIVTTRDGLGNLTGLVTSRGEQIDYTLVPDPLAYAPVSTAANVETLMRAVTIPMGTFVNMIDIEFVLLMGADGLGKTYVIKFGGTNLFTAITRTGSAVREAFQVRIFRKSAANPTTIRTAFSWNGSATSVVDQAGTFSVDTTDIQLGFYGSVAATGLAITLESFNVRVN